MRKITGLIFLFLAFLASPATIHAECVVLLHGLARTSSAMEKLQTALENNGYTVANVDYPSRKKPVEELSDIAVESGVQKCREEPNDRIHFVTHSLGGILVRYYLEHKPIEN
ncbi:MAG: alpha/beta hydrolase, partial [Gammaproteobacteria bacterium]